MDATIAPALAQPVYLELTCGQCGYLRTGLPAGALCPECGSPPPVVIRPLSRLTGVAQDRSQQAWLASISVGLIILIVSSYHAIQSELYINNGGLTSVIINAPAPKLTAGGCLLREMGNPAEWGVQGFIATLGTLLGVWLITEPKVRQDDEPVFSLRRCTRVVAILTFGGLFGGLLSGYEITNQFWGWWSLPSILVSVGLVELPTNTLLYFYLASLSKRFDTSAEPRPQFSLNLSAWLIAASCGGGVVLSALRGTAQDQPVEFWRWMQVAYGVLTIASGAIMTVGVLRLTVRMAAATLDTSMLSLPEALRKLAGPLWRLIAKIRSEPKRFAAVLGLFAWMAFTRPQLMIISGFEHRRGLGGDLPTINFIGPKLSAVALLNSGSYYGRVEIHLAVLLTLAAFWLITSFRPVSRFPWPWLVRWLPTLSLGAGVGFVLAVEQSQNEARQSYWSATAAILIETPGTLLAYLYCANLATAIGKTQLARHLRLAGWLASLMILLPMLLYVFSEYVNRRHQPRYMVVLSAIYGMAVIACSAGAWAVLVRLIWALVGFRKRSPMVQRSVSSDGSHAAIALANSGVGCE